MAFCSRRHTGVAAPPMRDDLLRGVAIRNHNTGPCIEIYGEEDFCNHEKCKMCNDSSNCCEVVLFVVSNDDLFIAQAR